MEQITVTVTPGTEIRDQTPIEKANIHLDNVSRFNLIGDMNITIRTKRSENLSDGQTINLRMTKSEAYMLMTGIIDYFRASEKDWKTGGVMLDSFTR